LPSTYDAPALATSLEKVIIGRSVTINSITVTDDPASYSDEPEATPQPKAVTFSFEGTSTYQQAQQLLQDFERSIRPFDLNSLIIEGTDNTMKLTVGMTTYYQPAKSLNLKPTLEVK
jgi:outer membrane protein OmpA-like peptidoglycan-associated protein